MQWGRIPAVDQQLNAPPRGGAFSSRLIGEGQAARTSWRNSSTETRSSSDWRDRLSAVDSTMFAAVPVSPAPLVTSVMFSETDWVPVAACWTFLEISFVEAPCSSTAAAIAEEI